MGSIVLSKQALVVLFDVLKITDILSGVRGLSAVSETPKNNIIQELINQRYVCHNRGIYFPDKGLVPLLLPISSAETIVVYNYGVEGDLLFNETLYFSPRGCVGMKELDSEYVQIIRFEEVDDILLSLRLLTSDISKREYVSCFVLNAMGETEIICAQKSNDNKVNVIDGKRQKNIDDVKELHYMVETEIFNVELRQWIKEVWNVSGS